MKKIGFGIMVLVIFGLVGYYIYSTQNPHPRQKSSEAKVTLPWVGKVLDFRQEFYPQSDPGPGSLKSDTSPYKEVIEGTKSLQNAAKGKPVSFLGRQLVFKKERNGQERFELWDRDGKYQWHCVNSGKYDINLTDGNVDTVAYPGSWYLDYVIDLQQLYEINKVVIVWGGYGEDQEYITSWKLYGQQEFSNQNPPSDSDWTLLKSGTCPNSAVTSRELNVAVRRLRITAESVDPKDGSLMNWIGIFEFEAYSRLGNK
jgi:hypothetical protein